MCKVPMNLQLFAEGDDAGTGDSGNGGGTGGDGGSDQGGADNPPSFDDFLKTGDNQAEFDRRLQKAINTAKGSDCQRGSSNQKRADGRSKEYPGQ